MGIYAWEKVEFDLEKQFTLVPGVFQNRPVTEFNIQEYVSDLIAKYMSQNTSPWHIAIIPTLENHHYILLRLHHILLNESLNIGDLLPLIPPTRLNSGFFTSRSPLVNVFRKPKFIPLLQEHLADDLSNHWNEFLSNYDPLERIELLKKYLTFPQFLAVAIITFIAIIKEFRRGLKVIKTDFFSRYKFLTCVIHRETRKRDITISNLLRSVVVSFDPRNILRDYLKIMWSLFYLVISLPNMLFSELSALYLCIFQGYCSYPNTFVGIFYTYIPLIYNALKEIVYILKTFFYAPKNIFSQILCQKEYLQTVTLSGRKCVAWSEPIKTKNLKDISNALKVHELEILLNGISVNLSKYLNQVNHTIPEEIAISLRHINSNYIFASGTNVRPEDSCAGILFMELPILNEERGDTLLDNLVKVKRNLCESSDKQQVSYLLSILQTKFGVFTKILPTTFLAVYLRYLSRKFAVSVTEVSSRYPNVTQRTLWGQEVESAIYWRPPQANISISLCLNEYADHVKLGVMCDARLVPNHALLARNFSIHVEEMKQAIPVVK
ncbi:hypothetical protein WA026_001451 [Henosepilachna vigintioctopunctata]